MRACDLSVFDQTEDVAALVGVKDDVVFGVAADFRHRGDRPELAVVELRKEVELPEKRGM